MMILREIKGATAIVTLNRPNRRNALSLELMRELIETLDEVGRHPQVHAVFSRLRERCFHPDMISPR